MTAHAVAIIRETKFGPDIRKYLEQIMKATAKKKDLAYVTRRWRLIAGVLSLLPGFLYKRIG